MIGPGSLDTVVCNLIIALATVWLPDEADTNHLMEYLNANELGLALSELDALVNGDRA